MKRRRRKNEEETPKRKRKRTPPDIEAASETKKRRRRKDGSDIGINPHNPYGYPMGGCTPFPPDNCPGRERRIYVTSEKVPWVDNYFCISLCGEKESQKCPSVIEYRGFLKKTKGMGRIIPNQRT